MDFPQFSGDVKEWPIFITTYRKPILDCELADGKNMERLQKCLLGSTRNYVN
jgi:hypothetical protein